MRLRRVTRLRTKETNELLKDVAADGASGHDLKEAGLEEGDETEEDAPAKKVKVSNHALQAGSLQAGSLQAGSLQAGSAAHSGRMAPAEWISGRMASDRMGIRQDGLAEVMSDQGSQLTAFNNSIEINSLNWKQAHKVILKHTLSGETPTLSNSKEEMDKTKDEAPD